MQRNILKKVLVCGVLFVLAFAPINNLYAAQEPIETSANLDESISGTYYVNAQHGLKMRDAPSTDADVVTLLPYKAEITVTGAATESWYKAEYNDQSGYVAANYLTKSSASGTDGAADTDAEENTLSPETVSENTADTFGTSSVITALIAAIIIMIILALYTAYGFLKKGNDDETVYDDEEYDDEEYDNEYDEEEYDDATDYAEDNIEYDDNTYEDEYDEDDEE